MAQPKKRQKLHGQDCNPKWHWGCRSANSNQNTLVGWRKNRHLTHRVQQRAVSELCKAPMGWVLSPRRDPRWPRVRMVRTGHGIEKSFLGESRKCSARLESPRLEQIFAVQLSV